MIGPALEAFSFRREATARPFWLASELVARWFPARQDNGRGSGHLTAGGVDYNL